MANEARFRSVLIANRGEIALRIMRACQSLGLRTIAVHSEADRGASYLSLADQAICIGPGPASRSYLDPGALLLAAAAAGAEAVHPGYGFLSENGAFADAVTAAGLVFIGPTAPIIRLMGDKIAAKAKMKELGVPCVPGSKGALPDDGAACKSIASEVGYPLIIKAAGGGGGRGMRVVLHEADLLSSIATTREEATRSFANGAVYMERFLQRPRHIEIQVLCDLHSNAVWLGARDCSVQRRHQKVIEEAPPPGIPAELIASLGASCARACRELGYHGVGTFEFLYEDGVFAFIEMNTRIQVEHPVTEMTTGIDIVREQIQAALGVPLAFDQSAVGCSGHSIECRINAEEPFTGRPSPGRVAFWHAPGGPGVRVDSHVVSGSFIPPNYDSMIGKIIVSGGDRAQCIIRMQAALSELRVAGISTNVALHQAILKDEAFRAGSVPISYLETRLKQFAKASA